MKDEIAYISATIKSLYNIIFWVKINLEGNTHVQEINASQLPV
jgi:hypothetical protein